MPDQPAISVRFRGDQKLLPEQILQAELGYRGKIGERLQPEVVLYAERITNLISDGALTKPTLDQSIDPKTGQFIIGFTGFQTDPAAYLGLGAEVGGKYSPVDGVDFSANYSLEKLADCTGSCKFDSSGNSNSAAVLGNTAQHKLKQLVSPGKRPITLVRRRTSSNYRSNKFDDLNRLRRRGK